MATATNRRTAVKDFVKRWTGRGDEISEYQIFWIDLIQTLFGVPDGTKYFEFQKRVPIEHTKFIDAYIPSTKVLIEQKSIGIDLSAPNRKSGDRVLTPYEQAKQYAGWMKKSEQPDYIVTCNFEEFRIYDMEYPKADPVIIKLENLERSYGSLLFLLEKGTPPHPTEEEISFKAGKIVGKLYDAFAKEYVDPNSREALHSLNVLCVRLVFCLYAEDADIFERDLFYRYMSGWDTAHMRQALIALFKVLDTPPAERSPYEPNLNAFPYVNGGLFSDENIVIPAFTEEIRKILLEEASAGVDWADISPTIFGAVFESTLNPETRRKGGMHYTSIVNIHKVIDPLFLDDLEKEFIDICALPTDTKRKKEIRAEKLMVLEEKLASLTFLDPACGSGNFLTETYICLRRLENDILRELSSGQMYIGDENWTPIKISINQFYGIEINDFAVTVAKTALWIAESQMMAETESIVAMHLDFLPLTTNAHIIRENALRMDWNTLIPVDKLNYIMGNPPFVGGMLMSRSQKCDMESVMSEFRGVGELDYVTAWFKKAFDTIRGSWTEVALVATNSISQGQQATMLWEPLLKHGLIINFAHRTFRWDSESSSIAHVHCVIIGFAFHNKLKKIIYDGENITEATVINQYLLDAPIAFVNSRSNPLCQVPKMRFGNMPRDGGGFILNDDERQKWLQICPELDEWIRPYIGADEFINKKSRWCLWLLDASPSVMQNRFIKQRLEKIKEFRLNSKAAATRRFAITPHLFCQIAQPRTNYILVPSVSSEKRRYVPISFVQPSIIASNLVFIIPDTSLYHFGILTSNVHMAWMRAVAGRLKSDYRYSKDIVYNNFPWPNPTGAQKAKIEETARAILDARALYPDSSLADLYDELTMPEELRRAHRQNDIAVMEAYGFKKGTPEFSSESACVAALMKMYQKLTAAKE